MTEIQGARIDYLLTTVRLDLFTTHMESGRHGARLEAFGMQLQALRMEIAEIVFDKKQIALFE
jgi:hypothetical protein